MKRIPISPAKLRRTRGMKVTQTIAAGSTDGLQCIREASQVWLGAMFPRGRLRVLPGKHDPTSLDHRQKRGDSFSGCRHKHPARALLPRHPYLRVSTTTTSPTAMPTTSAAWRNFCCSAITSSIKLLVSFSLSRTRTSFGNAPFAVVVSIARTARSSLRTWPISSFPARSRNRRARFTKWRLRASA